MVGLEAVAVNNDGFRAYLQLVQGSVHGKDGGVKYVDMIYLLRGNNSHRPCHSIALDNLAQLLATLVRQLLGVVEFVVLIAFGEDNGSSIHTACQTATSCFITACLNLSVIIMTC